MISITQAYARAVSLLRKWAFPRCHRCQDTRGTNWVRIRGDFGVIQARILCDNCADITPEVAHVE